MVGVVQQTAFVDDLLTIKTTLPQEERRSGNPHFGILESRDRRHRSISDLNVGRQQSVAPRRSNGRLAQCGARRRSKGDEIGPYVQRTTCVAPTWETGCRTKAGERWEGQAEDRPGPDAPVLGGIRLGASEKRGNKRTGADREGRGGGSRQDPGRFQTVRSLDRPLSGPQGSRAPAGRALQAPSGISMESHAGSGAPVVTIAEEEEEKREEPDEMRRIWRRTAGGQAPRGPVGQPLSDSGTRTRGPPVDSVLFLLP